MSKKFTGPAELKGFKAMQQPQKYTQLSNRSLATKWGIPERSLIKAIPRLEKRGLLEIRAVPKYEMFPELSTALLAFRDVSNLDRLKEYADERPEIAWFIPSSACVPGKVTGDVLLFLIHSSDTQMANLILEVTDLTMGESVLRILNPQLKDMNLLIPETILDDLYSSSRDF